MEPALVEAAARLAGDLGPRGTDALYVAVADQLEIPLITLVQDQARRGAPLSQRFWNRLVGDNYKHNIRGKVFSVKHLIPPTDKLCMHTLSGFIDKSLLFEKGLCCVLLCGDAATKTHNTISSFLAGI